MAPYVPSTVPRNLFLNTVDGCPHSGGIGVVVEMVEVVEIIAEINIYIFC
jgi:hypothetical protein